MSVRTWFRLQRGALWNEGGPLFSAVEGVAAAVCHRAQTLPERVCIGEGQWVLFSATAVRREELIHLIEADMRRAYYIQDLVR